LIDGNRNTTVDEFEFELAAESTAHRTVPGVKIGTSKNRSNFDGGGAVARMNIIGRSVIGRRILRRRWYRTWRHRAGKGC
jgi:hypothetical protein